MYVKIFLGHTIVENAKNMTKESLELKDYRADLKQNIRKFVFYYLVAITNCILGSLLFFYIEHCYDPVTPSIPADKSRKSYEDAKVKELFEARNGIHPQASELLNQLN